MVHGIVPADDLDLIDLVDYLEEEGRFFFFFLFF